MKNLLLDTATTAAAWVVTIIFVGYLFICFIVDYSEADR